MVLPILLARYGGMRQGDVLALPLDAWDGAALAWRAGKNKEIVRLDPPPRVLAAALERATQPPLSPERTKLCLTSNGHAWRSDDGGFRATFARLLRRLESEGAIARGLTFHGLRGTLAKSLAEAGVGEDSIKAYLGNRTSQSVQVYTRGALLARLTAHAVRTLDDRVE
jgi:integrase